MTTVYIPRALVVGEKAFTEEQLLREGTVFVILAEPGAGKTELLKALAGLLQTVPVRASIFRNRTQAPASGPLVIDAMDEVARIDKLATDKIIVQASERAATVIFAGRSSEWDQGRTAYVEHCFADNIARARKLLHVPKPQSNPTDADTIDKSPTLSHPCPCCGGRMIIIETFERGSAPYHRPAAPTVAIRIDTS